MSEIPNLTGCELCSGGFITLEMGERNKLFGYHLCDFHRKEIDKFIKLSQKHEVQTIPDKKTTGNKTWSSSEVGKLMDEIIEDEKNRCGEADAVTCWYILKEKITKEGG